MKLNRQKKTYITKDKAVTMESVQIQYDERDVDLNEVKKIASASARRIERDFQARFINAIRNNDSNYIRRELRNVSTYNLIKMILHKLV